MRTTKLVLALALLVAVALSAGCNISALNKGGVNGKVYDRDSPTGAGIVGATVEALKDNVLVGSNVTGPDGAYEFRDLQDGTHVLRASKQGYESNQITVVIDRGGTLRDKNIPLTPTGQAAQAGQ
jgi:hypothetical protein